MQDLVYVSNAASIGNAINAFPIGSAGDVPPVKTIVGSQTQLNHPSYMAFDQAGYLYVANLNTDATTAGSITVYAPGSKGNVAPVRVIAGQNTGFANARGFGGLAVDGSGYLYVAEHSNSDTCIYTYSQTPCTQNSYDMFAIFAPFANGNVAPIRTIASSSCYLAVGIAVNSAGELSAFCYMPSSGQIVTFAAGASGNATPIRVVVPTSIPGGFGGSPFANIALTPSGTLLFPGGGGIVGIPATANGNATATVDISGNQTQLSYIQGVAVDPAGAIYVLNFNPVPVDQVSPTLNEYATDANGNVPPEFVIEGSKSGFYCGNGTGSCTQTGSIAVGAP
jgi:hypothetical protein